MRPERILIINLNDLGDVLFSTPLIGALAATAELHYLVDEELSAALAHPGLQRIWALPRRAWKQRLGRAESQAGALAEALAWAEALREARFDQVINLQPQPLACALAGMVGAREQRGFILGPQGQVQAGPGSEILLLHLRRFEGRAADGLHACEGFLSLLPPQHWPRSARMNYSVAPADAEAAAARLGALGPASLRLAAVVGAGDASKRWPVAYWRSLFRRLRGRHPEAQVLLLGAAADRPLGRALGDPARGVHDLCGATRLGETAAILQASDVVVAGDTGPLHLACAVGTLCVGLFGPTHPSESGPWALESFSLRANDGCMDSLVPRAVAASVAALLEGEQQPRDLLRRHGVECWPGRAYQLTRMERAWSAAGGLAWLGAQSKADRALEILPLSEGILRRAQGQGRPLQGLDHALLAVTECLKVKVLAEERC